MQPPPLEFAAVAAPASRSPWLWVLLGVAAGSLLLAAWDAVVHAQKLSAAQQALQQAQALQPAMEPASPTRTPSGRNVASRNAAKTAGLHEQALQSLHRPWLPLLDSLERSANAPVAWRQWSVDSRFSRLQLEIEARALPEVFAYVAELQRTSQKQTDQPVGSVQLLSHEWLGAGRAASGVAAPSLVRARLAIALRTPHSIAASTDEEAPRGNAVRTAQRTPAMDLQGAVP
jgi:hypothetical protein